MIGRVAWMTDPGRKRRRNEDAYVCEPPLFAVADGMGGAQAGEIASRLGATALRGGPAGDVVELIQEANRRIYERSSEDEAVSGMGTTMTVALVENATPAEDTAPMAAVELPDQDGSDATTLSELEAVPVVEGPPPARLRTGLPRRRRRRLAVAVATVLALAVACVAGGLYAL